jgi:hypothetical protein
MELDLKRISKICIKLTIKHFLEIVIESYKVFCYKSNKITFFLSYQPNYLVNE